jgi:hypothetical protein
MIYSTFFMIKSTMFDVQTLIESLFHTLQTSEVYIE